MKTRKEMAQARRALLAKQRDKVQAECNDISTQLQNLERDHRDLYTRLNRLNRTLTPLEVEQNADSGY